MVIRVTRTTLAWLFTAVYWTAFAALFVLSFRRLPDRLTVRLIRTWGRIVLWMVGIRLIHENAHPFDRREARVVVVNHQSALDVIWGATIFAPGSLAIGKKEVIWIPLLNLVWWALGFIRIDRGRTKKAIRALRGVSEEIIQKKRTLFIAPEGTRTGTGEILPFKKGAFHIAMGGSIPIHPVVVSGAFELMPKGTLFPEPGVVRLSFPPPIPTEPGGQEELEALISGTRDKMITELQRLEADQGPGTVY